MKPNKMFLLLIVVVFSFMTMPLWPNNVVVENVSLIDQNTTGHYTHIKFDISWENSWRTSSAPNNWDAVWVFAKYRIGSGAWAHCTLDTVDANHTAPSGSTIDAPNETKNGNAFAAGIFIYRSANGSGSNNWDNAKLRWNYGTDGVTDDAIVEVKVFAIEMVYIPQGEFHLFSGESPNFYAGFNSGNTISSEDAMAESTITWNRYESPYCGAGTSDGNAGYNAALGVNYPKGFKAIYCMKYEISQGQWVDFLNTLTRIQQNSRTGSDVSTDVITNVYVMSNTSSISYRCDITCPGTGNGTTNPITFTASRPDRACNWLSWADGLAYADWAGLRPMTELEYEKICRGPETAGNEYAWGNTTITAATTISGTENGTETITNDNANCCYGGNTFTGGDGGQGPLRCGIFATSSSNRQQSGASYYGVMELSGNLWERFITVAKYCWNGTWIATGVSSFDGQHGDGVLTTDGFANVTNWPSPTVTSENTAIGSSYRGGGWSDGAAGLCVSDRYSAAAPYAYRRQHDGFRLSRTQ